MLHCTWCTSGVNLNKKKFQSNSSVSYPKKEKNRERERKSCSHLFWLRMMRLCRVNNVLKVIAAITWEANTRCQSWCYQTFFSGFLSKQIRSTSISNKVLITYELWQCSKFMLTTNSGNNGGFYGIFICMDINSRAVEIFDLI